MNFEEIKNKLKQEKEQLEFLLENIHHEGMEIIKETTSATDVIADQYETKEEMHFQEEAIRERIKKIEKALKKIDEGNYGICEKCGQPIEEVRLKIDPAVETCRRCSI